MRRIGDRFYWFGYTWELVGDKDLTGDYTYRCLEDPDMSPIRLSLYSAEYLGNFAKSHNFNSLYEKLVG